MSKQPPAIEAHEGEWIYLAVMASELGDLIRAKGWLAIEAGRSTDDARSAARRLHALRTANACVIDISTCSVDTGAEIATAVLSGRPVIALENVADPPSKFIEELLAEKPRVRKVRYSDSRDRVQGLARALEDPAWLATVGDAARHGFA
jgi:hypothetical protein